MQDRPLSGSATLRLLRHTLRLGAILAVVIALYLAFDWVLARLAESAHAEMLTIGMVALLLVTYSLLIALPFVPGIEIGLSLLMIRGAEVAPFVYLATVAGLMLAFLAGRHLPLGWLARRLSDLRLRRAAALVLEVKPLTQDRRLARLRSLLPPRFGNWAIRWRYALLAILINLPGSGLIGGGGGICLVAGLTGVYDTRLTAVTVAIAVAPLPLVIWALGIDPASILSPV